VKALDVIEVSLGRFLNAVKVIEIVLFVMDAFKAFELLLLKIIRLQEKIRD
jgi:hypothetical protein